jgi:hypothetical protein
MPRKSSIDARPPRLLGWRAGLRRSRWRTWRLAMAGRPLGALHHIIIREIEREAIFAV